MLAIVSDYGDIDFSRRSENLFSRFYARLRDNSTHSREKLAERQRSQRSRALSFDDRISDRA